MYNCHRTRKTIQAHEYCKVHAHSNDEHSHDLRHVNSNKSTSISHCSRTESLLTRHLYIGITLEKYKQRSPAKQATEEVTPESTEASGRIP